MYESLHALFTQEQHALAVEPESFTRTNYNVSTRLPCHEHTGHVDHPHNAVQAIRFTSRDVGTWRNDTVRSSRYVAPKDTRSASDSEQPVGIGYQHAADGMGSSAFVAPFGCYKRPLRGQAKF